MAHIDRTDKTLALVGHSNFAQVEPNHLSAPRNGGVYAQLPADDSIETLEQGMFVHYDMGAGKVAFKGNGPVVMVFNEEKFYDERKQMHRDYAMQKADSYDGVIVPRCFRLVVNDIFTTNCLAAGDYTVGTKVAPSETTGELATTEVTSGLILQVVAETTLPDGQPAVKLQVISE